MPAAISAGVLHTAAFRSPAELAVDGGGIADAARVSVGVGEGLGDSVVEGLGDGVGEGLGDGVIEGLGDGVGEGLGDGVIEGLGDGVDDAAADRVGVAITLCDSEAVAVAKGSSKATAGSLRE